MICGVTVTPLARMNDARGAVLRMLRSNDAVFDGFGEIYFSIVGGMQAKEWRRHSRSTSQLAVPIGNVQFVLAAESSSASSGEVAEITIGELNYQLLTIPAGIWFAFANTGNSAALVANCSSGIHDLSEISRRPLSDPPLQYQWPR